MVDIITRKVMINLATCLKYNQQSIISNKIRYLASRNYLLGVTCSMTIFETDEKGLVAAGIGDLQRPADKLSISQSASLAATGLIWSRYSLVIIPKNYSLFAVNVFVASTQCYQLFRAVMYAQSQKAIKAA